MATSHRCPICRKATQAPRENEWFPFCSNRCKVMDLSKWLNNEYAVPATDDDETEPLPEAPDGQHLH